MKIKVGSCQRSTMQPLKTLKLLELTWPLRKQPSDSWMLLARCEKKLKNILFSKKTSWLDNLLPGAPDWVVALANILFLSLNSTEYQKSKLLHGKVLKERFLNWRKVYTHVKLRSFSQDTWNNKCIVFPPWLCVKVVQHDMLIWPPLPPLKKTIPKSP